MNKNKHSDKHYRRGIVLGLTFAELLMLLLFVVLLVLGTTMKGKSDINHKRYNEKELSNMSVLSDLLKDKDESAFIEASKLLNEGEPDKAYQKLMGLDSTTGSTKDELVQMNQIIGHIKSTNPTVYAKIQGHIIAGNPEKAYQEIVESSHILMTYKNIINDCRAQNKHLVAIKNVGRGGDFPSCWFDEAGAKQFIYNIELTDKGIVVHDNHIPSREEEKKRLPLEDFKLGMPMQPNEFMKAGQKIRKISDDHSCRFFVKIADKTSPEKKEHYKKLRNTVENIFYKKDI